MTDAELAAALEENYLASFSQLARTAGGRVLDRDHVTAICTGLPVAGLNHAFIQKPTSGLEDSLVEIIEFFEDAGAPFIFRVREGSALQAERL